MFKDWYQTYLRGTHESARESTIYDQLKKGPVFEEEIEATIPRESLVEKIRQITTPAGKSRLYPLIIGEHGTGKTSLITLAVNDIDEPKGIVYVDIPLECDSPVNVAKAMQKALGWSPDQVIDSSERNYNTSFQSVLLEANRFAAASLGEVLQVLSRHAIKYKQEYGKIPVLIIDNANRLAQKKQELLDLLQDYAKDAADKGRVTVVFVSSEGRVPRHMMGKSIM
jgi:KaiC/GvpD/RAD55 family RecA-like ATPase